MLEVLSGRLTGLEMKCSGSAAARTPPFFPVGKYKSHVKLTIPWPQRGSEGDPDCLCCTVGSAASHGINEAANIPENANSWVDVPVRACISIPDGYFNAVAAVS